MKKSNFLRHPILVGMGYALGSGYHLNNLQDRVNILNDDEAMQMVHNEIENDILHALGMSNSGEEKYR